MIQKTFRTVVVVMASSLCVSGVLSHAQETNTTPSTPTQNTTRSAAQRPRPNQPRAQAPAVQVPPEFNAAIAAMQSAKSSLEKAGDKWGGHRVAAIRLINKSLNACGQKQTPNPAEMKSGQQDEPALMQAGITQLTNAKNDFEKANNDWGGRRAKAISFIDQALKELQTGLASAKTRKKPKAQ